MDKYNCPSCGKLLVKLNDDEHQHEFWCDSCNKELIVMIAFSLPLANSSPSLASMESW